MIGRPVTPEALEQLRQERLDADRRYNEALTALDRAIPAPATPLVPPVADAAGRPLDPLNRDWNLLEGASFPPPRGVRSRFAHFVWSLVRPFFERQQAFNSRLVEHLNERHAVERSLADGLRQLSASQREQATALAAFHVHLIQYLQQVTPYADTKDREVAGSLMAVYDAALNAITDELLKRWESLSARDARLDSRVAAATAVVADQDDLRASLALVQQSTQTLKRELARVLTAPGTAAAESGGSPAPAVGTVPALDSYKYVGFEDRFRGSQTEIRRRLAGYVDVFAGARDVLDIGCGRGELLDLLREAGIAARGVDLNHEMVEICRERGLVATQGDWVGFLESLPDASLGGLVAIQVVEHLEPSYLLRALEVSYDKLRPGATIVLETINPACWFAFFSSYVRDLTHQRPVHPETLQYLLTASGFQSARIEYKAPYPEHEKLRSVPPPADATSVPGELVEAFNANVARLNSLMFTDLDYAAVARRL